MLNTQWRRGVHYIRRDSRADVELVGGGRNIYVRVAATFNMLQHGGAGSSQVYIDGGNTGAMRGRFAHAWPAAGALLSHP